jgi:hypothetical protein
LVRLLPPWCAAKDEASGDLAEYIAKHTCKLAKQGQPISTTCRQLLVNKLAEGGFSNSSGPERTP